MPIELYIEIGKWSIGVLVAFLVMRQALALVERVFNKVLEFLREREEGRQNQERYTSRSRDQQSDDVLKMVSETLDRSLTIQSQALTTHQSTVQSSAKQTEVIAEEMRYSRALLESLALDVGAVPRKTKSLIEPDLARIYDLLSRYFSTEEYKDVTNGLQQPPSNGSS